MRNPTREDLQVIETLFTPIYPKQPGLITTAYARWQNGPTASGVISDLSLAAIPITLGAQVGSPLVGTLAALFILSHFKCAVSRSIWRNHGYPPEQLIQIITRSAQDYTPNQASNDAFQRSRLEYPLTEFQYLFAENLIENSQNALESGQVQFVSPDKNSPKFPHTALAVPRPDDPRQLIINPNPALLKLENGYGPTMGQVTRLIQEMVCAFLPNYYTSV